MSFYVLERVSFRSEIDVWCNGPTPTGIISYSVITPILCGCGIFGNIVSLMVLKRKELVGSVYTYLAVLACVDLGMSIVLIMGGISRGIMWRYGWVEYDSLISLPLGGALNTLGVLAIMGLTIDRVIYLWNPVQCTKPKFCRPEVARRLMVASVVVAVTVNLPYCFIFKWGDDENLNTTEFFDSQLYKAFNWFTLVVFAIVPTFVLLLGNGFLIKSLRKAKKINRKSKTCRTKTCKRRDHTNLTITLVMIIVFFLIINIPENLVSRTAAINLLFKGDQDKVDITTMENLRQICSILGAIDVNTNSIFYYTFCPAFCKALKSICRCKRRPSSNLQVNVFVLNGKPNELPTVDDNKKCLSKVLEISRKSIESGFTFNLSDIENDKGKNERHMIQDYEYISDRPGEYVEMANNYCYTPPFSTILEESYSTYSSDSRDLSRDLY